MSFWPRMMHGRALRRPSHVNPCYRLRLRVGNPLAHRRWTLLLTCRRASHAWMDVCQARVRESLHQASPVKTDLILMALRGKKISYEKAP